MSNERLVWDLVLGDIIGVKELTVLTQVCKNWHTKWENVTSFKVLRGTDVCYQHHATFPAILTSTLTVTKLLTVTEVNKVLSQN